MDPESVDPESVDPESVDHESVDPESDLENQMRASPLSDAREEPNEL